MTEIKMVICPAGGKLTRVAEAAAHLLEQEGFGKKVTVEDFSKGFHSACRTLLVESGYEKSCSAIFAGKKIKANHHLVLKNLGLEEDAEATEENVELIKDGIIAECVVLDSQAPKFNCPCGFS